MGFLDRASLTFVCKTTIKGALVAAFGKSTIKRIMEAAMIEAGEFYAVNFTLSHFDHSASAKYGYAKRKHEEARAGGKRFARVAGPAEKAAGQILPLIFSGELRRVAQTYQVRAIASDTKCEMRVIRPAAKKALRWIAKRPDIDMAAELTSVCEDEKAAVIDYLNDQLMFHLEGLSAARELTWS